MIERYDAATNTWEKVTIRDPDMINEIEKYSGTDSEFRYALFDIVTTAMRIGATGYNTRTLS